MKKWLNDFKLALIEEDVRKLQILSDGFDVTILNENLTKKSYYDQGIYNILTQTSALLQEAIILINEKKKSKALEIQKFQKALKYFQD